MNTNPYAAPAEVCELLQMQAPMSVWVDGRYLVVSSFAVLPYRCVVTNQPIGELDRRMRRFEWAPSFRFVLQMRRCQLTYGVSKQCRQRVLLKRGVLGLMGLIVISVLCVYAQTILVGLYLSPVVALFVLQARQDSLKISHEKNGQFWIAGCGKEFLLSLKTESVTN